MIMRFDFEKNTWLFLGCEPGTREFEIITEVQRLAVEKGYGAIGAGRIASRLVEMTQREKYKDISSSHPGTAQEEVKP